MLGEPAPSWMTTAWLLACFGPDQVAATEAYQKFVMAGISEEDPLRKVRFQCILGDDAFVTQHRKSAEKMMSGEIAMEQRRAQAMSLTEYALKFTPREIAMAEAYRSTAFSMSQIAAHFGVSVRTVSRAVATFDRN
jgi:putative transposase